MKRGQVIKINVKKTKETCELRIREKLISRALRKPAKIYSMLPGSLRVPLMPYSPLQRKGFSLGIIWEHREQKLSDSQFETSLNYQMVPSGKSFPLETAYNFAFPRAKMRLIPYY